MKKDKSTFRKDYIRLLKKHGIKPTSLEEIHEVIIFFKDILQDAMEVEQDGHLGYEKYQESKSSNSRNGYLPKTAKGILGKMDLKVPKDRDVSFKPKIFPKGQKDTSEIERKILALYSRGTSTRDIVAFIEEIYGIDMDPSYISKITNKLLPKIEEFRTRKLDKIYPMIFIDGIRFKTQEDGISKEVSVYIVLGYKMNGMKEVLGYWIGESETSKYWLIVFNDLKSRGLERVLIFSSDNLPGISKAISTAYPGSKIQKCVIHQIRNSMLYVGYKDKKEFVKDMKKIYMASNIDNAKNALDKFEEKWSKKYNYAVKSWRKNFDELVTFFDFPHEIRKLIYTTNVIENLNQKIRKVTKNKSFPNLNSLHKMVYLAIQNQHKKWIKTSINWGLILNQLTIFFDLEV